MTVNQVLGAVTAVLEAWGLMPYIQAAVILSLAVMGVQLLSRLK